MERGFPDRFQPRNPISYKRMYKKLKKRMQVEETPVAESSEDHDSDWVLIPERTSYDVTNPQGRISRLIDDKTIVAPMPQRVLPDHILHETREKLREVQDFVAIDVLSQSTRVGKGSSASSSYSVGTESSKSTPQCSPFLRCENAPQIGEMLPPLTERLSESSIETNRESTKSPPS